MLPTRDKLLFRLKPMPQLLALRAAFVEIDEVGAARDIVVTRLEVINHVGVAWRFSKRAK